MVGPVEFVCHGIKLYKQMLFVCGFFVFNIKILKYVAYLCRWPSCAIAKERLVG
jgi:hypothetical protein